MNPRQNPLIPYMRNIYFALSEVELPTPFVSAYAKFFNISSGQIIKKAFRQEPPATKNWPNGELKRLVFFLASSN